MALVTPSCCSQLAAHGSLNVVYPNTTAYTGLENTYWALQEATIEPACFTIPTSAQEVSVAVSCLAKNGCHFAIKGGGHSPNAGFANVADGVTIDMSGLDRIALSGDHATAHVGAGAHWVDVYAALDMYNKTVAGGRNGAVGVGGLTLGGGISYFSPQVGFTCDTVTNFEVVLADGCIVNANKTSEPDLYRALKGGTTNFGVVTRFDFATIDYTEILAGSVANDISHRGAVFDAFAAIGNATDYDVHASIVTSIIFNSTSKAWSLASTPIYTLPETTPPVYKDLLAIPSLSNNLHPAKLSVFSNETATPPLNWGFGTGTYGVSAELLDRIFDICNETLYSFDDTVSIGWVLAFEPLPTAFVERGQGHNSLGTSAADGNSMILLLSPLWPPGGSVSNEAVHAKTIQLLNTINSAAKQMGLLKEFVYTDYADASQVPIKSYGPRNVAFLRETARKYDPHGVFQRLVNGGFKV